MNIRHREIISGLEESFVFVFGFWSLLLRETETAWVVEGQRQSGGRENPKEPYAGLEHTKLWDHGLGWNQESECLITEPPRLPKKVLIYSTSNGSKIFANWTWVIRSILILKN